MQVYGKTIDGIKDLLRFLLSEPSTGRALKRQVAFLFDFEEIEHTTVLGLTLQVRSYLIFVTGTTGGARVK